LTCSRTPGWERSLEAYLASVAGTPFRYGRHDCAAFAAGAVQAQTGIDFYSSWRGKYQRARSALRLLAKRGFADVEGPFTAALGEPQPVLRAQRGDIVSDGSAMGVRWSTGGLFVGEENGVPGLLLKPLPELVRAWVLGHE
jgi:hypothetical protein